MSTTPVKGKLGTFAVSLTNFLDSGCIVAGASGLALWADHFNLSSLTVGLLGAFSANAFGSAIGALIGGHLADKFGRKFIMTYNMIIYMLGALLVVFAVNPALLFAGFLVLGLSVGAGVPASWTYLSETAETTNRAKSIGASQFAWSLGPAIIFTLGTLFAPLGLLGNRLLFVILFVVALIAWILQRKLEESASFTAEKAKQAKAPGHKRGMFKEIFAHAINIRAIGFLVGVYLFWNLVAGAMGFFMPYVYTTCGGLTDFQANMLQAVLWVLTALATYFGFAKLGDKIDQKKFFFVGALMAIISWAILTFIGFGWGALWAFVIIWGISAGIGAQAFYALWATELFAAKYRGGAQGIMFFAVRGACGIWSIVFPVLLGAVSFQVGGSIMIGFLIVSLVIGTIWAPKTQGKTLAQIEAERYGE
ncbi:MAG: MFS transporter [Lactobacillales bacterium]|jgi:inositol transporter-like SP family MFS transporter|nr:MFS transporter [Lactobacillales bacterium]